MTIRGVGYDELEAVAEFINLKDCLRSEAASSDGDVVSEVTTTGVCEKTFQ